MSLRTSVRAPQARRLLFIALAVAACTDTQLPTAATAPAPARPSHAATPLAANPRLVVVPASAIITHGRGIPLRAVNVDPLSALQANAPITWSSSNPAVATVSNAGQLRAVAPGTATITASAVGQLLVATSAITVKPRPNCATAKPLPVNFPGLSAPLPTTYEDTPLAFQFTTDDPDPCHKYTFRLVEDPVIGVLYQVAEDGTPRTDRILTVGTAVTNPEGWVAFAPTTPVGYYGSALLRYDVRDQSGRSSGWQRGFIDILPVNDPPIAIASTHVGDNNSFITTVQLVAKDLDDLTTDRCIVELPLNGDLYWNSVVPGNRVAKGDCRQSSLLRYVSHIDGIFGCSALPAKSSYPHADSFRWYASDGRAASDTVPNTIRIDYVNQPPVYHGPTSISTNEDAPVTFTLSALDPDGNPIAYLVTAVPGHGALFVLEPGSAPRRLSAPALLLADASGVTSLQYVPDADFNTLTVSDEFHFEVSDGDLLPVCDHVMRLDIAPVNDAPTIFAPDVIVAFVAPGGVGQPTGVYGITASDDARPIDVLSITLRAQGPAAARIDIVDPTGFAVQRVSATEIQFEGTLAAVNALLGRGVQWTPNASGATYGELAIVVDDRGSFGSGGARVGTKIVPVDVATETDGLERTRVDVGAPTRRTPAVPDRR